MLAASVNHKQKDDKMTKQENQIALIARLCGLGFTASEVSALIKIERTLHRWDESECGNGNDHASWCVERDEETDKPYRVTYPHTGKSYRTPIADREAGAKKRLEKIMAAHPELVAYHQGDCRGVALYIVRKSDIPAGQPLASCYTVGIAVAA